ncbi:hypothetical protein BZG36_02928 [Bifiguratus adelaidae]|uniref:RRM domain-containing protein n=1 Tax=Bifiguratus adelaidae TaxID=1938954 RepID=A0A261Y002_9FUNG|nr:hypothetical protein BZG36_02928 [Bifiguratus adelaidae]
MYEKAQSDLGHPVPERKSPTIQGPKPLERKDKRRSKIWLEKRTSIHFNYESPSPTLPQNQDDNAKKLSSSPAEVANIKDPAIEEQQDTLDNDQQTEVITTALVIKNIPFAVKRDALMQTMNGLDIPRPYAFNYHFDNGVFRGLAFANYRSPEEAEEVKIVLNGFEIHGRKLRVEYKKMLQSAEGRERDRSITDMANITIGSADNRDIEGSGNSHELSRESISGNVRRLREMRSERDLLRKQSVTNLRRDDSGLEQDVLDLNDPDTLAFYNQLLLFRGDTTCDDFTYPRHTTPTQRKQILMIADKLGLTCLVEGDEGERYVRVLKANRIPVSRQEPIERQVKGKGSKASLHKVSSRDNLNGLREHNATPPKGQYRKPQISGNSDAVIYPIRQPKGPENVQERNFASRKPKKTLNHNAPAFSPRKLE